MNYCRVCGKGNDETARFCVQCASRILEVESERQRITDELGHIEYLLRELPDWRARGWVWGFAAKEVEQRYTSRQRTLRESLYAEVPTAAVAPEASYTPPPPSSPLPFASVASAATEPEGVAEMSGRVWLGEFLQEHWLKLVGLVAAALIFIGMRNILGWTWVNDIARVLLPVLPLGLGSALIYFGFRSKDTDAIGSLAYCGVGVGLAAFSVFSINRYWLGEALSPPLAVCVGSVVVERLSHLCRRITGKSFFLGLQVTAGFVITLSAVRVGFPAQYLQFTPPLPYSIAVGCLSALYFVMDHRLREQPESETLVRAGHVAATLSILLTAFGVTNGEVRIWDAAALVYAAGMLYAVSSCGLDSPGLARVSALLVASGAATTLAATNSLDYYGAAIASMLLALFNSIFADMLDRSEQQRLVPLAAAYRKSREWCAMLAPLFVILRVLAAGGWSAILVSSDWRLGLATGSLGIVFFGYLTWRERDPILLYPLMLMTALATALIINNLFAMDPRFHSLLGSHALIPFLVLATIGILISARGSAERRASWSRPIMVGYLFTGISALLDTLNGSLNAAGAQMVWLLGGTVLVSSAALFGAHSRQPERLFTRCTALLSVASLMIICATVADSLLGKIAKEGIGWAIGVGTATLVMSIALMRYRMKVGAEKLVSALIIEVAIGAVACFAVSFFVGIQPGLLGICAPALATTSLLLIAWSRSDEAALGVGAIIGLLSSIRLGIWIGGNGGGMDPLWLTGFASSSAGFITLGSLRVKKGWPVIIGLLQLLTLGFNLAVSHGGVPNLTRFIGTFDSVALLVVTGLMVWIAVALRDPSAAICSCLVFVLGSMRLLHTLVYVAQDWRPLTALVPLALLVLVSRIKHGSIELFRPQISESCQFVSGLMCVISAAVLYNGGSEVVFATTCFAYGALCAVISVTEDRTAETSFWFSSVLLSVGWISVLATTSHPVAADRLAVIQLATMLTSSLCFVRFANFKISYAGAIAAGLAVIGAWHAAVMGLLNLPPVWCGIAFSPLFAVLAILIRSRKWGSSWILEPLSLTFIFGASICFAATMIAGTFGRTGDLMIASGTSALYAAMAACRAATRKSPDFAMFSSLLVFWSAAYFIAQQNVRPAEWSCLVIWFTLPGLLFGMGIFKLEAWKPISQRLFQTSVALTSLCALVGFVSANEPHQGIYGVITLLAASAIFAGHFLIGREEYHAHLSFLSLFAAYSMMVYDNLGAGVGVLDIYVIPIGIYLLLMGHLASRRENSELASALWWGSALSVFGPTYLAFSYHFRTSDSSLHTVLLLAECVVALGWGIPHRIKAFALSGAFFTFATALQMASGAIREIWSGVFSMVVGLLLLGFVFYVSVHKDVVLAKVEQLRNFWREWR